MEAKERMKKKYVDINLDKTHFLLPGRQPCECQALKHKLINNCLKCGRIVCEQEGSGPCFFCQNLVCSQEEQDILNRGSKASDKLLIKLMTNISKEITPALQKALDNKNKLLNFDRLSTMRTQVIDDQADYFYSSTNSWLPPEENKKLENLQSKHYEEKYSSKFNKSININLNLNSQSDDIFEFTDVIANIPTEIQGLKHATGDVDKKLNLNELSLKFNASINEPQITGLSCHTTKVKQDQFKRVQDEDLISSFDQKKCLSMHQPFASLLIFGVKKEEGRNWYTGHRGKLWIASTSKQIPASEIKEVENNYKIYYNSLLGKDDANSIKYPPTYPNSVLLGCVNIDDCVPQEDFRKMNPNGLSESPYVWLCSEPKKLKFNIPILGKPKIFDLDMQTWRAATKNLIYDET